MAWTEFSRVIDADKYDMRLPSEMSLPELLYMAMTAGIIDRFCVDPTNARIWQGNLRLQFTHDEAVTFIHNVLRGYQNARGDSDME